MQVAPPDDGWEFGPDPSGASPDAVFEIFLRFFDMYLLSVTSLLLYSVIVLLLLYRIRLRNARGTEMMQSRLYRSGYGLLLASALFPILYAAMWIAEGTTSAEPDLPAGGVFGTSVERWIIGPDPSTQSPDMVLVIIANIFEVIFTSWTTLGFVVILLLVMAFFVGGVSRGLGNRTQLEYLWRIGLGTGLTVVLLPVLYTVVWVATGREEATGELRADGIFGTTFEQRLIGPETETGYGGLIGILGNAFETYQVTLSFLFISILVFLVVAFILVRWPAEGSEVSVQERLYRAGLGLAGSMATVPVLYAISWVAVGVSRPEQSFTRVAPAVELPTEQLYGGPRHHPFIESMAASKDPVETMLLNAMTVQSLTYLTVGILVLIAGIVVMVLFDRASLSSLQSEAGYGHLRSGIIVILAVFLLPAFITGAAWLATGPAAAGTTFSENLAGSPFHYTDDFETCTLEGWTATEGTAIPSEYSDRDGCALELFGTAQKQFDLRGTDQNRGYVDVVTNDNVTVRIYDGGELVAEEVIRSTQRFDIPVTGVTTVELEGRESKVDSVSAGLQPLRDPYLVVELTTDKEEFIFRNGVTADVRVYNIGSSETRGGFNLTLGTIGTTYNGTEGAATNRRQLDQLSGGQWREFETELQSFDGNRTIGTVQLAATTNLDDWDIRERGPDWDNYARKTITITYADLWASLPADRVVTSNETAFEAAILNNGTAYSETSTATVEIVDGDGEVVYRDERPLRELDPNETVRKDFAHVYETPGTYTATVSVDDELFPEGNTDRVVYDIQHGDLRGEITDVDSSSRIGTQANISVAIENAGTARSEQTTATVEVLAPSGEVSDSWVVSVEELAVGETTTRQFSADTPETGEYTVNLNVVDREFPIGSTDQATFDGVGPDPRPTVTTASIKEGEQVDVETRVVNRGTDYSNPTTATVTMVDPDGAVVEQTEIDVRGLEPGESQTNTPFSRSLSRPGSYEVEMSVDTEFESSQNTDRDSFSVLYEDLGLTFDVSDRTLTDENRIRMVVTNHGTGRSESVPLEVRVVGPDGSEVAQRSYEIQSLRSGDSTGRAFTTEHTQPGTHRVEGMLDGQEFTTEYDMTWPDYRVGVNATSTEVRGFETTVNTSIWNAGPGAGEASSATLTVYDSDGRVVDRRELAVSALESGEVTSRPVSITFPAVDSYTVGLDVDDPELPEGNTDRTEPITTTLPDLRATVDVDNIDEGDVAPVNTTVVNTGKATSNATTATVTLVDSEGTVRNETTLFIESLPANASQSNTTLQTRLEDSGVYTARINVSTEYVPEGSVDEQAFRVRGDDLRASVVARNVGEDEPAALTTRIANVGELESNPTTATVTIEDSIGRVVEQTEVEVGSIAPGDEQVDTPLSVRLPEPGQYVATVNVSTDDATTGTYDRNGFRVEYVDLRGELFASDTTRTDTVDIGVAISNDGTGRSEPVDATLQVLDESGTVVEEWDVSTQAIGADRSSYQTVEFTAPEAGTYTARVDVVDQGRPEGTVTEREFDVRWPDLRLSLTPASTTIESSESTVDVTIRNDGPGASRETSAYLEVRERGGEVVMTETLVVPEIDSGETYTTSVPIEFVRPGPHRVHGEVTDVEFPAGNTAQTGELDVRHANLAGSVSFRDDASVVETDTVVAVTTENIGTARSESGETVLEIINEEGDVVETRRLSVPALSVNQSHYQEVTVQLADDGKHTARVDVVDPEFPADDVDTDTIQALTPDLRASVEIDDVELNRHTDLSVTVENVGDAQSASTIAEVRIFNQNELRVVYEELAIEALAPGESVTVTYSQLIDERCWKTEMTCAPGAKVEPGTYTAEVVVQTEYAPEGSVATKTFRVR